jgi:hypothetical protein
MLLNYERGRKIHAIQVMVEDYANCNGDKCIYNTHYNKFGNTSTYSQLIKIACVIAHTWQKIYEKSFRITVVLPSAS